MGVKKIILNKCFLKRVEFFCCWTGWFTFHSILGDPLLGPISILQVVQLPDRVVDVSFYSASFCTACFIIGLDIHSASCWLFDCWKGFQKLEPDLVYVSFHSILNWVLHYWFRFPFSKLSLLTTEQSATGSISHKAEIWCMLYNTLYERLLYIVQCTTQSHYVRPFKSMSNKGGVAVT